MVLEQSSCIGIITLKLIFTVYVLIYFDLGFTGYYEEHQLILEHFVDILGEVQGLVEFPCLYVY